jgi:hypothetical protein
MLLLLLLLLLAPTWLCKQTTRLCLRDKEAG